MASAAHVGRKKPVLLLSSSHGRFTTGSAPWVRAVMAAFDSLDPAESSIITSVGLPGWELPAFTAAQRGFHQKLILPGRNNGAGQRYFQRCLEHLGLCRSLTEPVFTGTGHSKAFRSARDALAFALAVLVFPLSLRPGGRLDTLLGDYVAGGGEVCDDYRAEFSKKSWLPRYNLDKELLNTGLKDFGPGWLTHWTHSCPGPWPGETAAGYYHDILNEPENYVRNASATLAGILAEGVIRGSGTHMAASEMTVSLTSLPPLEALATMRWRSRYRRWNMEPYGIAVRREALVPLGARQVSYYDKMPSRLSSAEKIFSQRRGRLTDWSGEREWRIHGELRLDQIDPDQIALLVYDNSWAGGRPELAQRCKLIFPILNRDQLRPLK